MHFIYLLKIHLKDEVISLRSGTILLSVLFDFDARVRVLYINVVEMGRIPCKTKFGEDSN